jgi:hypothetical protein
MENTKSTYFKFEEKFLEDKELLSIIDCGNRHNLNIENLMTRNVNILFMNSIDYPKNEFITDLICQTTNNFYLYLSTTVMENSYMLKIYYKQEDRQFVKLLLKTFKK